MMEHIPEGKEKLEHIIQTDGIIEQILSFHANPYGFLVMHGDPGSGKTFAGKAICNEIHHMSKEIVDQCSFAKRVNDCSDGFDKYKYYALYDYCKDLEKVELLMVDALGFVKPPEPIIEYLYYIFDKRWENRDRLGTIITTHLNKKDFSSMFGALTTSRTHSNFDVPFLGYDRRRLKREQEYMITQFKF